MEDILSTSKAILAALLLYQNECIYDHPCDSSLFASCLAPLFDVFALWVYATVEGDVVLCILFGLGSWEVGNEALEDPSDS
nr:hypothetical protein [Tanacetum cinerariifolium]